MENPFPGMDPWMEQQWGDAHASLVIYARDQIAPLLPADLKARVEERVYVATERKRTAVRQPDLRVTTRRGGAPATGGGSAVAVKEPPSTVAADVALAAPRRVILPPESATEGFIEIRERLPSGRLVTVIEVLSPENKRAGRGRREYLAKQRECLRAGINLVEVDLPRRGRWTVVAPPEHVEDPGAYRVCVWCADDPDVAAFYPIALRERLPAFEVPLRPTDKPVRLDLQPLIDQTYRNGDYADTDYGADPDPPLEPADAPWAQERLKAAGLRV